MILQSSATSIPRSNCFFTEASIPIHIQDLRHQTQQDDFDTCGFTYIVNGNCNVGNVTLEGFTSEESTDALLRYLEQTRLFVLAYFDAERVICINWRLRKHMKSGKNDFQENARLDRNSPILPAYKAHADLSPAGGLNTLKAHLSKEELHDISQNRSRVQIINCWRPLVDVIEDVPLAMCDRRSVNYENWLQYDRIDDTGPGEGMWLKQRDYHKWYWFSDIAKKDIVLFQSWDSEAQDFQGHRPHAAFINPATRETCPPRTSIEVRLIVVTRLKSVNRGMSVVTGH